MVFERGQGERDPFQRDLLEALRDPELCAKLARLQARPQTIRSSGPVGAIVAVWSSATHLTEVA